MADQIPCHAKAMATILGLLNIPRCPGTFKQHNMTSAMQRETKSPGSISCKQQIGDTTLKTINGVLSFRRPLAAG